MLDDLLSQYVVQRLIEQNHPTLNGDSCLNKMQKRFPCAACANICPLDILRREGPLDWVGCENCDLCVSVCPTRAFVPDESTLEKYLTVLHAGESSLHIACTETGYSADLTVPCLASLPWELLCCFALKKDVALLISACQDCEKPLCAETLQTNLARVQEFLGDEYFHQHVHSVMDKPILPPKEYSRRDLFSQAFKRSKSVAGAAAASFSKTDIQPNGLFFRRLLLKTVAELRNNPDDSRPIPPTLTAWVPAFSGHCWACGSCAKICPHDALAFSAPDDDGACHISITPWKCTGCGLCKNVFVCKGISDLKPVQLHDLQPLLIHKVRIEGCEHCGKPIKPGTHQCPGCFAKAKSR